ncbi:MAG: hypothetical protein A2277_09650 [Desulfobacterales bacterium RIFOXYA12_FULL_46_15]|nr:MAG: hypothetical protein A2277_09650 [Desulfobacterales bacterium RIFOXYA12_FULL_46_15]
MQLWLLIAAVALLTGCATLSEQECLDAGATSWEEIGWVDGCEGYHPDRRLDQHYEACSKVGVSPDQDTYMAGWSRGILEYCTPDRGYAVGLSGSRGNPELCPYETRAIFQDNVKLGLRIYELKQEMDSLYYKIENLEKKLDDKQLDKHARRDIRERIRRLDHDMSDLRWQLNEARSISIIRY